jgi:hypothetical protein
LTKSTGVAITGGLELTADEKVQLGTSGEFDLYHSTAGDSYIETSTGNLFIKNQGTGSI